MINALGLLKRRRFLPLFSTQFLGAFNDNLFKNAMVLFVVYGVFNDEASETLFSAVATGLFILPFFLLSALAGQLADTRDKAMIIRIVKFCEILIMAVGGAGLVFTEATAVSPEGRISPADTGIWNDTQRDAWKRIVDFVHAGSDAKIAMQIGHAGRKGSTRLAWDGIDLPLDEGNWPLISASPLPYIDGVSQTPREMTRADMGRVKDDFVQAARRAAEAGFDWLELHCAHGYLLSSFISPLTNQRTDEYGGSLENRLRYPLEVFRAVRAVWPDARPMSVRISAHDWVEGGITPDDAVQIARAFKAAGADLIDCSSGQVSKAEKPVYGRMFQTPFADRVRNEAGIPTIAVGAIFEADHVNSIIASGRADLCALARPHLADPFWTLHEAAKIGYKDLPWPAQYYAGKRQYETNLERAAAYAQQIGK